jgi:predicted Zn-dependent protease
LTLVRLKRSEEALDLLRRAAELEPGRARYAYVYAVALKAAAGRATEALSLLKQNLARHPDNRDTLQALIAFTRDAGDVAGARAGARLSRSVLMLSVPFQRSIRALMLLQAARRVRSLFWSESGDVAGARAA